MASILIIDDDEDFRTTLSAMLGADGNVVDIAKDGFQGAEKCRVALPDFVLLDMQMPYGGLPTLRVLLGLFPGISVIAMSGADQRRLEMACELGAIAFLVKPFSSADLRLALQKRASVPPSASRLT